MVVLWAPRTQLFTVAVQWVVRGARGELVSVQGREPNKLLRDDEWTDRSITKMGRLLFADTRRFHEEMRDGVLRLQL